MSVWKGLEKAGVEFKASTWREWKCLPKAEGEGALARTPHERIPRKFPGRKIRVLLEISAKCLKKLERAMGFEPTTPTLAR